MLAGSARDAASPPFAFAVNPRLAVFTTKTGAAKFPAPATRELYLRAGARLLATGENGAALVETDGRRLYARTMF